MSMRPSELRDRLEVRVRRLHGSTPVAQRVQALAEIRELADRALNEMEQPMADQPVEPDVENTDQELAAEVIHEPVETYTDAAYGDIPAPDGSQDEDLDDTTPYESPYPEQGEPEPDVQDDPNDTTGETPADAGEPGADQEGDN